MLSRGDDLVLQSGAFYLNGGADTFYLDDNQLSLYSKDSATGAQIFQSLAFLLQMIEICRRGKIHAGKRIIILIFINTL